MTIKPKMHNIEAKRVREVNKDLDVSAFGAAWEAFQSTPIDLVADSDDEVCRCVHNAIVAYFREAARLDEDRTRQNAPDRSDRENLAHQALAERLWRIHPREIQDLGITRQEFYEREIAKTFDALRRS